MQVGLQTIFSYLTLLLLLKNILCFSFHLFFSLFPASENRSWTCGIFSSVSLFCWCWLFCPKYSKERISDRELFSAENSEVLHFLKDCRLINCLDKRLGYSYCILNFISPETELQRIMS